MKRIGILLSCALLAISGTALSARRQGGQKKAAAPVPPYFEVIQGLYINQLQQFLELTDDQYLKVAALLKEYLRAQYELEVPGRNRAVNQLRQATNRGATDEELTQLTQEFDRIETELGTIRVNFLTKADPLLQIRQRARLRLYMINKENQIRNLIQASQNPGGVPKPAPAPPPTSPTPNKPLPH